MKTRTRRVYVLIFVTRAETGAFWQMNAVVVTLVRDYDAILAAYDDSAAIIVVSNVAFDRSNSDDHNSNRSPMSGSGQSRARHCKYCP